MRKYTNTTIALLALTASLAAQSAYAKQFNPPMLNDRVVHQCASGPYFSEKSRCSSHGQHFAADAFCKKVGLSYATYFKAFNNPNKTPVAAASVIRGQTHFVNRFYHGVFSRIDCS